MKIEDYEKLEEYYHNRKEALIDAREQLQEMIDQCTIDMNNLQDGMIKQLREEKKK